MRRFVTILVAWNAWWCLVVGFFAAPALPGGWVGVPFAFVAGLAPVPVLGRIVRGELYPGAVVRVWVLRPFWYVQLGLPLVGVGALMGGLVGLPFGAARAGGLIGLCIVLAGYVAFALAGYWGSRRLVVRAYDAGFATLPPGLDGLRIVQLSDLHVGPHTPRRFLERVRDATRDARPDLIAITGDQVDDHDRDVAHFAHAFGDLRAPLGVFAIAGNHDVYAGWDGVREGLVGMGVRVLVNEAVPIERNGERFFVAGTGDPAGRAWQAEGGASAAPDIERTMEDVPADAFVLALAHNPALWPALARRGVALTLSGHTHHGQFSVPFLNWCLASPFLEHSMGPYGRGASLLFINPGTNYWGIPLRLGAWPEVSVITLRRGEPGVRVAKEGDGSSGRLEAEQVQ